MGEFLKVVKVKRGAIEFPILGEMVLILIIYDTVWMHRIHEQRDRGLYERLPEGTPEVRAKYALVFTENSDTNVIGQYYAMRGNAHEAEWTHDFSDLPAAMERLRARHAGVAFPEEINFILDYPDYKFWQHIMGRSSPEEKERIRKFLEEAGKS